jgi:hypothetical protein
MLDIGRTGGERSYRRAVGKATPSGQEADKRQTAPDLEATAPKVSMGNAIARKVEGDAEQRRRERRLCGRSHGRSGRDMHRDDHGSVS